ncbi:MAG: hypothetical protein JWP01_1528 [Myxococcales bacterium]|nr:hypothetical protein [Myxococcales bacterium]
MKLRSRFTNSVVIAWLAACGGTPQAPTIPPTPPAPDAANARAPDPDLEPRPVTTLLSIDWTTVPLATEADGLAVWTAIAPTGADWDAKLDEVPVAQARRLAIALLQGGNFVCKPGPKPVGECTRAETEIEPPADRAGLADPCLRRLLALWSIAALEPEDLPAVSDALRAIVAIPPPESQLVSAAIQVVPETDQDRRLELISIAYRAGQTELANTMLGGFDEAHLIEAVTKHRIDAALEVLSAEGHRAVYLTAIADERLAGKARAIAISELVAAEDTLAPDAKAALVTAAKSTDCSVAATAARALEARGDKRFVPTRPRTRSPEAMMRALCVLASYERLQGNDEDSRLAGFVPPKGLERLTIAFDGLAEVDTDGDGDPHTERTLELVPRAEIVMPEIDDVIRAFRRCTGTTCSSADRDFRFGFKPVGGQLYLARLEIVERPPCPR